MKDKLKRFAPVALTTGAVVLPSFASFAESATADSSLVSGATNAVAQVTANIQAVVPIALGILGTVLAIKIGVRVFKSLTKSSAG